MFQRSFKLAIKKILLFIDINKNMTSLLQKNYGFSHNQILFVCWFKGLWTGILISLVLHHMISH